MKATAKVKIEYSWECPECKCVESCWSNDLYLPEADEAITCGLCGHEYKVELPQVEVKQCKE